MFPLSSSCKLKVCCHVLHLDATKKRIKVDKPVVELDGDEMTRIIWAWIKEKVRFKFLYIRYNVVTSCIASLYKQHL